MSARGGSGARGSPAGSGPSALGLGALLGVILAVGESVLIVGGYWYQFPTGQDIRRFVLCAIAIDVTLAMLVVGLLVSVLGRAGWPIAVGLLAFAVAATELVSNFPGSSAGLGGTAPALVLVAAASGLVAWLARRVPEHLPESGGARWRFVALLALVPVLAVVPDRLPRPDGKGPDVLLFIVDTLRADRLSLEGDARVRTPHLDRLARHGLVAEDVVTASNTTTPSIASILTSTLPITHGVDYFESLLAYRFQTLAEQFQQRGYRTFGFSSSFPAHLSFHQLDQGLDYCDDSSAPRPLGGLPPVEGLERLSLFAATTRVGLRLLPQTKVTGTREADLTTDAVLAFLRRDGASPFFGLIHYYDPHTPYDPPRMFSNYDKGLAGISRGNLDEIIHRAGRVKPDFMRQPIEVRDPGFLEDSYDGEVMFVDYQVGRVLAEVRRRDRPDATIVAVIADHGESLFEHDILYGHRGLYQQVLSVPFIMVGPGVPAGTLLPSTVRSIDVAPTILDLARQGELDGAQGKSIVPLFRQAEGNRLAITYAAMGRQLALRRGPLKLIRSIDPPGPTELYDVYSDPGELRDLAGRSPELDAELDHELDAFVGSGARGAKRELDEEQLESLEALGYVE